MKWSEHPVAHLRKVAIAYKKELGVGAVSKMSKPDLIVLLDKHLILGDDGKISIKGKSTESKDLEDILEVKPKMKREVKEKQTKSMEKKEGEDEKMVKIMKKKKMY